MRAYFAPYAYADTPSLQPLPFPQAAVRLRGSRGVCHVNHHRLGPANGCWRGLGAAQYANFDPRIRVCQARSVQRHARPVCSSLRPGKCCAMPSAERAYAAMCCLDHPEIQHKKPQFQYNLYQQCGGVWDSTQRVFVSRRYDSDRPKLIAFPVHFVPAISVLAFDLGVHAICSTAMAYGATGLCAPCAVSRTDLAYGTIWSSDVQY
eukprot:3055203-Rhodomonas_salina.1